MEDEYKEKKSWMPNRKKPAKLLDNALYCAGTDPAQSTKRSFVHELVTKLFILFNGKGLK
jgi:hypothetical protein